MDDGTFVGFTLSSSLGIDDGSPLQRKHVTGHSSPTTVPLILLLHHFPLLISSLSEFVVINLHVRTVSTLPTE